MAKKKAADRGTPKRFGTLIRVSDAFAEALREAASFERMSHTEYADTHLLPFVKKQYRDALLKKAKRMEGEK